MRKINLICSLILSLVIFSSLFGASNTFIDYQNYNHGYCPDCNCYPCKCGGGAQDSPPYPVQDAPPPACAPCGNAPCKKPDPCAPAPVCGTNCGISLCYVGLAIAGVAAAAAIIVTSNNGSVHSHPK